MTRSQAHIIINYFSNLSINQQVHIAAPVVNYVISPFEGNISAEDPQGDPFFFSNKKGDRQGI